MKKRLTEKLTKEEATRRVENILSEKADKKYFDECVEEMLTKIGYASSDHGRALNKLGKLEDIEDEIKMPLDFFVPILITPFIYIKPIDYKGETINKPYRANVRIMLSGQQVCLLAESTKGYRIIKIEEKGIMWALTKEELEPHQVSVLDEEIPSEKDESERKPF